MKILSTTTVFASKYLQVKRKEIERNGKKFTKDFIQRNPFVLIIPYTANGDVYMESQFRDAFGKTLLEVVAGTMEEEGDPLATAKRELKEETGLTADTWKKIAQWELSVNMNSTMHVFAATDLHEGRQQLDDDEEIAIMKMPFDEILHKIETGEINCGHHIAALLLFDRLRKKNKL
jgi:ADP-ribose pyrophosphatase